MESWLMWVGLLLLLLALGSGWNIATRIARIESKLDRLLRQQGVDPLQGIPLSDRVKEIARDPARKIEAIKIYREETGAGLAEAKSAVEAFMDSQ